MDHLRSLSLIKGWSGLLKGGMRCCCGEGLSSLYNKYRTMGELHNPIGAAADQSFVQRRVAGCADDEQLSFKLLGKFDNVPHRMSGNDMGVKLDMIFLSHCPRPLQNLVKASCRRPDLLANLLDELRHVVDLFHAHHV